jgi:hypothetical protein
MKICKKCGIEKEIIDFSNNRSNCKKCNKDSYYKKIKNGYYDNDVDKVCNICNIEKKSNEFRTHRLYCKKCENKKTYESRKDTQSIDNKDYMKIYQQINKDKINERMRTYKKERNKSDILYKFSIIIRRLVGNSLKLSKYKKTEKSIYLIGLSKDDFRKYIESKFESWMNWGNYGKFNGTLNFGWDVDHIIPTSSATTKEELYKLNHYTNLQPLCSYVNRYIKKDKLNYSIR